MYLYLIPAGFGAFVLIIGAVVFLRAVLPSNRPSDDSFVVSCVAGFVSLVFAGIMLGVTYSWYHALSRR